LAPAPRPRLVGLACAHVLLAIIATELALVLRVVEQDLPDPMNVIRDEQLNRKIPTNAWNTILSSTDPSALQGEEV
jgi:hypothetical protein